MDIIKNKEIIGNITRGNGKLLGFVKNKIIGKLAYTNMINKYL